MSSTCSTSVKYDKYFDSYRKMIQNLEAHKKPHTFVIFGASGDLAKKEIYSNLYWLFRDKLLPEKIVFIGYARSKLDIKKYLKQDIINNMKINTGEEDIFDDFVSKNYYISGQYDDEIKFQELNSKIIELTKDINQNIVDSNRVFYLAVPPSVYQQITTMINKFCRAKEPNITRIVLEKPFGKDLKTSNDLSNHLSKLFREEEIFRIDHYLGKEMVQSLFVLRFANKIFKRVWNRDSIESVMISFKEKFGTKGRGGYFDEYGIIRDVMQNHLLQVLTLVAMEQPVSNSAEEIRNEKVKVLKCIEPIKLENTVLGQYVKNEDGSDEQKKGYLDDETVKKDSLTATFATLILKIKNERWDGVPFIMSAGKALDETKTEVCIQFKSVPANIFDDSANRNELIIRIQPDEAIYLKVSTKSPGMNFTPEESNLDLTYSNKYKGAYLPRAYERLLLDLFYGGQISFVRSDELAEAWRIFTPLLHKIENEKIRPIPYKFGSHTIPDSDELVISKGNFNLGEECGMK